MEAQSAILEKAALEAKLKAETLDITIPGKEVALGHKHPMYTVLDEIKQVFLDMGFEIMDGPEIELESYNFTKLNAPESHPSRDWTDTFYLTEDSKILLRTQTSPMQIRAMEEHGVPIRMISPGRVYRKDEVDATHSPMFHQIEGLVVDKGVTMADLKGTLNAVIKAIYGANSVTRFRPHHFPFTEPSCEVDIQCHKCGGKGCPTCKGEGWIEVLGHMVHPQGLCATAALIRTSIPASPLRHGSGTLRHGPLQDQRPAADLRKRRTVPAKQFDHPRQNGTAILCEFAEPPDALAASGSHVCTLSGVFVPYTPPQKTITADVCRGKHASTVHRLRRTTSERISLARGCLIPFGIIEEDRQ